MMMSRLTLSPVIPSFGTDVAPLIAMLAPGSIVVEVGSYAGHSAEQWAYSRNVKKLICVDNWAGGYDAGDAASDSNFADVEAEFDRRVTNRFSRVLKLKMSSLAASTTIRAGSIDLVYIDADHRYESVRDDIAAWRAAVKPGGILAGHDYNPRSHPGVVRAVNEALGEPKHVLPDTSWYFRL